MSEADATLMNAKLLSIYTVMGPFGETSKVQYYADGSIRFRVVGGGPMALTESFLSGHEKDVVLRVANLNDDPIKKAITAIVEKELLEWSGPANSYKILVEDASIRQYAGEISFQVKFLKGHQDKDLVLRGIDRNAGPSISGYLIYKDTQPGVIDQAKFPASISTKITQNGSWAVDTARLHYHGRGPISAGEVMVELNKFIGATEDKPKNCLRPIKVELRKLSGHPFVQITHHTWTRVEASHDEKASGFTTKRIHHHQIELKIIKLGQDGEYAWARLEDGSLLRADNQWWASVDPAGRSELYSRMAEAAKQDNNSGCIPIWRQDPTKNTSESCAEIRFPGEDNYQHWAQLFYDFENKA